MAQRPDPPQLRIDHLSLEFGGVRAIDDVSIDLSEGGICGLIGPNGAGKTSLLNCISGFYAPTSGDVTLDGRSLLRMRRHQLIGRGIARTFQNLALFGEMSVFDNVAVGASRSTGTNRAEVWAMLERFDLVEHSRHLAQGLPFGTLKRVEFARALMSRPRLLLLDEPAGGLTHSEVDELGELIREVPRGGAPTASMLGPASGPSDSKLGPASGPSDSKLGPASGPSVLLVEHHMGLILSVCERIVVLDSGRKIADGPTDQVRDDPAVINAYLGGGTDLVAHR